jgi:guanine nucleotide-binding protein subunit alpha
MSLKGMDRDDPLTLALAPPEHESPQDRECRLRTAFEAKRRSDDIDEEINRMRAAEKKKGVPVKVLLLG